MDATTDRVPVLLFGVLAGTSGHLRYKAPATVKNERRVWVDRGNRTLGACVLTLAAALCAPAQESRAATAPHAAPTPTPEQELVEDQLRFEKARGLDAYVALREIWDLWEGADPRRVEAALELARNSRTQPEPVRAYAGVLSAYARMRRGETSW